MLCHSVNFWIQVEDPLNWMVLDNNNNLGWGPEVLGLAGQNFGPKLAAAPPGWFDKRSWTSGFSGGENIHFLKILEDVK